MGIKKVVILPCAIVNYTSYVILIKDADMFILKSFLTKQGFRLKI